MATTYTRREVYDVNGGYNRVVLVVEEARPDVGSPEYFIQLTHAELEIALIQYGVGPQGRKVYETTFFDAIPGWIDNDAGQMSNGGPQYQLSYRDVVRVET